MKPEEVELKDLLNCGVDRLEELQVIKSLGEGALEQALTTDDAETIARVALAYETVVVTWLDSDDGRSAQLYRQSQIGAFWAYHLRKQLGLSENPVEHMWQVLSLGSLAYCSDQEDDLKGWVGEHKKELIDLPPVDNLNWNYRLLRQIYDLWLYLFGMEGWCSDDLGIAMENLSRDVYQRMDNFEKKTPLNIKDAFLEFLFIFLFLYWKEATVLLVGYKLKIGPADIEKKINLSFKRIRRYANRIPDIFLDTYIPWLHVASRKIIEKNK